MIINQLGNVETLVVGGYHTQDCVKRVGEIALSNGINTIIDLDMTDLFFNLYRKANYFDLESYSPESFKNYMLVKMKRYGDDIAERIFYINYQSEVYDCFVDNGWADRFTDLPSDENNLIKQLYEKVPIKNLIDYVDEYLS